MRRSFFALSIIPVCLTSMTLSVNRAATTSYFRAGKQQDTENFASVGFAAPEIYQGVQTTLCHVGLCAMDTPPLCQQAGDFLEQHPRIEGLADMSRTPGRHGALCFPGRDMSGDGNNGDGSKLTHLAQVSHGFPSIHVR